MEDLRGVLHLHTVFSDGVNTLEEMAEAARERGYAYLGVADHSQSAHYAGGLRSRRSRRSTRWPTVLNRRYRGRFRILKGIESDILADGSLDYPPEILARFDFVVASVHSRFRMSRDEQTKRIIAAVSNPYTTILGHLTGRQLLRRPGYELDLEAVLEFARSMASPSRSTATPTGWNSTGAGTARRWNSAACSASIPTRIPSVNSIL